MPECVTQYKKVLKKNLRCSGSVRERLLAKFDSSLSAFLDDTPAPDKDAIHTAFGPPKEMADLLMAEVTPEEAAHYRRKSIIIKIISGVLAGILAITFIVLTWRVYIEKQNPVEFHNAVYIEVEGDAPETYPPYTGE